MIHQGQSRTNQIQYSIRIKWLKSEMPPECKLQRFNILSWCLIGFLPMVMLLLMVFRVFLWGNFWAFPSTLSWKSPKNGMCLFIASVRLRIFFVFEALCVRLCLLSLPLDDPRLSFKPIFFSFVVVRYFGKSEQTK